MSSLDSLNPRAAIEAFPPQGVAEPLNALSGFGPNSPARDEAAQVATEYLSDPIFFHLDYPKRFAALYLFSLTRQTGQEETLTKILQDEAHPTLRVMAAGILIGYGNHPETIPVLIDALCTPDNYPFSQQPLWTVPQQTLPVYTETGIETQSSIRPCDLQSQWYTWWETNQNQLAWDGEKHKYVISEEQIKE